VELFPERHQAAVLQLAQPLGYRMPFVMDYAPGAGVAGLYFRLEGEDRLLAGLHSNELLEEAADPDEYFRGVEQAFLDSMVERLLERLPSLDDMGMQGGWSGLYPMTQDGEPIIGPTARPGVYACAGFGGLGVYLSPIAGRLLAEEILDGGARTL
jgi:sarcosine oxidase subunit beta